MLRGGIVISKIENTTKGMLDYAKQLTWLGILLSEKLIDADEYLKIKKALKVKCEAKSA